MVSIYVEAEDVWKYFQNNKLKLGKTAEAIAENDEFGVVIYLSEERGLPMFEVDADGYQYHEESAVSANDCRETVQMLYDKYLTEKFLMDDDEEYESLLDIEDQIAERELELDDAVISFLDVVLDEDSSMLGAELDDIVEDVKDHICEYLARKHELPVRRPMILEDDDGDEFFEEYPYDDCLEFEDEDNPIYKK